MTFKNNRAPLLSIIKLYASFHHHMWIQTGVTVRKRLSWVVTSVTLTFDLWPWPFAWTSLLSLVITPENFMMIRWWELSQKGVTDRQTDGRTDGQTDGRTAWTIHRAAWSQLKTVKFEWWMLVWSKFHHWRLWNKMTTFRITNDENVVKITSIHGHFWTRKEKALQKHVLKYSPYQHIWETFYQHLTHWIFYLFSADECVKCKQFVA